MIFTLGTMCNLVAVWCVMTSNKISLSVKIILTSIFITSLGKCLVIMPLCVEMVLALLWGDPGRVIKALYAGLGLPIFFVLDMELLYNAMLACISRGKAKLVTSETLTWAAVIVVDVFFSIVLTNVVQVTTSVVWPLAGSQINSSIYEVVAQAACAMIAIFVSNLLLTLPFAVFCKEYVSLIPH
ncbi:hypothetical protein Hamer_G021496 [Homarus americanus]|uniref:Uncharacterized protein n=1 Tax=Homarus americanus TaxID=6706 RepID=A0A8J5MZ22_HOMAM|nr:hypothetical protein Hamer_G021496 [Homarus americanus]